MRKRLSLSVGSILLGFLLTPPAVAETARVELGGGYAFLRDQDLEDHLPLGWLFSVTGYVGDRFGITGELNGNYKSIDLGFDDLKFSVLTFMGGVKLTGNQDRTAIPYLQSLAGLVRASVGIAGRSESQSDWAIQQGGGVDVMMSERLAVRVGGDYRLIFADVKVHEFRVHIGVSYRLGIK